MRAASWSLSTQSAPILMPSPAPRPDSDLTPLQAAHQDHDTHRRLSSAQFRREQQDGIRYYAIDCRSEQQRNRWGRFATAFFLDPR